MSKLRGEGPGREGRERRLSKERKKEKVYSCTTRGSNLYQVIFLDKPEEGERENRQGGGEKRYPSRRKPTLVLFARL